MKLFEEPVVEVVVFEAEDTITTSETEPDFFEGGCF